MSVPTLQAIRSRKGLVSFLLSIVLTVVAYPSAVFLGASLSHVGLNDVVDPREPETVRLFPDPEDRSPTAGVIDPGGRVWQIDPATKFMERVIHDGEGVGWNPYSAAGMLGPETLADMKLSPFVVLVALFGASSTAYTFVFLGFAVVAVYCLQQLFVRSFEMQRLAAVAAALVFLLGGWATAALTSQMSAPYLLFPVVLYTLVEFLRRAGPLRLLLAVAAYAGLLLTTFVPGVVLMLLLVHPIALVFDLTRSAGGDARPVGARVLALIGRQAVVPAGAVAVTPLAWLPVVDAYNSSGAEMAGYGRRQLEAKDPIEALSLLTPRHVFRTYLASTIPRRLFGHDATVWLGVIPLVLVAGALPRSRGLGRRVLVVCLALGVIAAGQHMAAPLLSSIGNLPGLRTIAGVYWASLAAGALVLAVGVAVEVALRRGLSVYGVVVAGAAIVVLFGIGALTNWRPSRASMLGIAITIALMAVVVGLVWFARTDRQRSLLVASLVVAVMFVELYSYQNPTRVKRFDFEDSLPPYITFVQENLGDGRVLNVGRDALNPEWGSALGIRQAETLNVMQIPEYRSYFTSQLHPGTRNLKFLAVGRDTNAAFTSKPGALDNLAIRFIIVTDDMGRAGREVAQQYPLVFDDREAGVRVFENVDAFPRVHLAGSLAQTRDVRGEDEPWRMDRPFTSDGALLAAADAVGIPQDGGGAAPGRARLVEDGHTRLEVEVEATSPAVLVVADTYHENWSATVNGEQAHVGPVNDVLRGIVVPEGRSVVAFEYHSPERVVGTAVSVASAAVLVLGCVVWALWRRRTGRTSPAEQVEPGEEVGRSETAAVG